MSIVLLLQMMGGWDRWRVVDLQQGVKGETGGGYYLVVIVFFVCLFVCFDLCFSAFVLACPLSLF